MSYTEHDLLELIVSKYKNIDELKADIKELEADIKELEAEFLEKPTKEGHKAVAKIIKKYGPAERLKHPSHVTFVTVLSMTPNPDDDSLDKYFPMKGYIGRQGDCVLTGHIKFSVDELLILNKYNISWKYSCLGQAENLKNLEQ